MSQAEYDYYASVSGLPATAKLEEHQRAFWEATIGASFPSDTLGELERKYLIVVGPPAVQDRFPNLNDMRFAYYSAVSGLAAGSLRDHMQAFFLNPGVPTEQRRNRFLNPAGAGPKPWSSPSMSLVGTQATDGPVAGARWQKFSLTAEETGGSVVIMLGPTGVNAMPVQPNTQYTVSAYLRQMAGSLDSAALYVFDQYDAAGAALAQIVPAGTVAPVVGQWARDSKTIVTGPTAAFIRPRIRFNSTFSPAGAEYGAGGVLAELGAATGSYFDGGFASCEWVGAADDSASILLG